MCTKINIKEDLTYNVICNKRDTLHEVLNPQYNKSFFDNQNDMQLKLTSYLVESLRTSSNKIIRTVLDTTSKF